MQIEEIFKRNHVKMPFQIEKITEAVFKAMISVKNGEPKDAELIANQVNNVLLKRKLEIPNYVPNVEEIQDLVEQTLMQSQFFIWCRTAPVSNKLGRRPLEQLPAAKWRPNFNHF